MIAASLRALERFVFPNACVACEGPIARARPDALLCRLCVSRMHALRGGCPRCAHPMPPVGPCRFCAAWRSLAWVRSAVWLGPEARALAHHLKYEGFTALGDAAAEIVTRVVERPAAGVLVPIPLGRSRLKRRGYNQAECLASALGRRWGVPVRPALVGRTRETVSQTALKPEARAANVNGAFRAVRAPSGSPGRTGGGIILVDDVLTTGATLAAAADACASAGWTRVGAITFTRALPYELRAVR